MRGSAGFFAAPLVALVAKLAEEGVGENDLEGEAQGVAAEEFFRHPVFGAAVGAEDLRPAIRTDYFWVFDTVNHLQQQDQGQTGAGDDQVSDILLVGPKGKEYDADGECHCPDDQE